MVVVPLPDSEPNNSRIEIVEAPPTPELLLIDSVAAFDLAVLLGAPRLDVAVPNPKRFDGEGEGERELLPVVALELADPEWKRPVKLI